MSRSKIIVKKHSSSSTSDSSPDDKVKYSEADVTYSKEVEIDVSQKNWKEKLADFDQSVSKEEPKLADLNPGQKITIMTKTKFTGAPPVKYLIANSGVLNKQTGNPFTEKEATDLMIKRYFS